MDPRDHKGEEGVIEAAEDGMAGENSWRSQACCAWDVNHHTQSLKQ